MALEVHFTPIGQEIEHLFTILNNDEDSSYFLFSNQTPSLTVPISLQENIFHIIGENPFAEDDEIVTERLVGLSLEWIEQQSSGFESAPDEIDFHIMSYEPHDIFVENKPFSLHQLVSLIDAGDIELDPDFQRNFVWDKTRQSRLIESILLGLPLPSIYLSQYEDGRLTVVDGVQRLTTIRKFLQDELKIINPEYLEHISGLTFSQLSGVLSPLSIRRFSQTQIMCFVIDYRSPQKLKFDLFKRLNTTGKPLNSQEIRNSLSRVHIQQLLKQMISLESFHEATGRSVSDKRMDARDSALRFLFFLQEYFQPQPLLNYNGRLDEALDNFIDILNESGTTGLQSKVTLYDKALKNAFHLFGSQCFRKVLPSTISGRKFPVSKLFMMILSVLLSRYDYQTISELYSRECLIIPLANFIDEHREAFGQLTRGTDQRQNIISGFNLFSEFLSINLIHEPN